MLLDEELALVARAKNGDRVALGMLWDDITPKLCGYLVNTVRNRPVAEDILQDTWLKAITALEKFEARGVRFSAWLFAIARNECRQYWRKSGREELVGDEGFENVPKLVVGQENVLEKIYVDEILNKLSEDYQEVLRLRYIAGFSFKEIAKILGISTVVARVRVHRAVGRLRENLERN